MRASYDLAVAIVINDDPEAPGGKNGFAIYRGSTAKGTREFTGQVVITDKNPNVESWKTSVRLAARPNGRALVNLDCALIVRYRFTLKRPISVSVTKRPFPTVRPDWDNLIKATQDALTEAGVWRDDSLIVDGGGSLAYAGYFHADGTPAMDQPGCVVDIFAINGLEA
jgi:Holliday junction resolvase RusA-like endonuclease